MGNSSFFNYSDTIAQRARKILSSHQKSLPVMTRWCKVKRKGLYLRCSFNIMTIDITRSYIFDIEHLTILTRKCQLNFIFSWVNQKKILLCWGKSFVLFFLSKFMAYKCGLKFSLRARKSKHTTFLFCLQTCDSDSHFKSK